MAKFKAGDTIKNGDTRLTVLAVGKKKYFLEGSEQYGCSYDIGFIDSNYTLVPKEILITREKLGEAWDRMVATHYKAADSSVFKNLCKELGL